MLLLLLSHCILVNTADSFVLPGIVGYFISISIIFCLGYLGCLDCAGVCC